MMLPTLSFSRFSRSFSRARHDVPRTTAHNRAAGVCALCALVLLSACEGASVKLTSDPTLADLAARVEALEADQADQAAELVEARAALGECLAVAYTADANANAAQEHAAALDEEIDETDAAGRLAELEELVRAILITLGERA